MIADSKLMGQMVRVMSFAGALVPGVPTQGATRYRDVDEAAAALTRLVPTGIGDVATHTYLDGREIVTITATVGCWLDVDAFCREIASDVAAGVVYEGEYGSVFRLRLRQDRPHATTAGDDGTARR
jgi:hypothetical protein